MQRFFDLFKSSSTQNEEILQRASREKGKLFNQEVGLTELLSNQKISSFLQTLANKTEALLAQKNIHHSRVRFILPNDLSIHHEVKDCGCMLERPTEDGHSSLRVFICSFRPYDFSSNNKAFFINADSLAQTIMSKILTARINKEVSNEWIDNQFGKWEVIN